MSLYKVFSREGLRQLPYSPQPISTTGRNNGVTTLYITVEKPMSKAQNANLFRDPKIFLREYEKPWSKLFYINLPFQ